MDDESGAVLRGRGVRRPRMLPFLLTGAVLGALVGLVVSGLRPDSPTSSVTQQYIVMGLSGLLLGGLLGAVAFLIADGRSGR